ncbi:unnamed protein product (macronuclear) [Paramecium tetraurelia]|uniref:Uncharacterized protein n=1 Tax=Paramecium tetraurelia TaxID=5888 RepID=A0EGF9_PARTE|nr:uncharacterized protein GSPATT00026724001 [Paramecium tetraurelia]CAK94400.1 unnamed protein product [Paramecium tetraurelia]|eukprot:XP_001461773.1 hypothetical protein (macronuclear) [Paramecium tetraurelia strain d4-2]
MNNKVISLQENQMQIKYQSSHKQFSDNDTSNDSEEQFEVQLLCKKFQKRPYHNTFQKEGKTYEKNKVLTPSMNDTNIQTKLNIVNWNISFLKNEYRIYNTHLTMLVKILKDLEAQYQDYYYPQNNQPYIFQYLVQNTIAFQKQILNRIVRQQTDHILTNQKMKMKIQSNWQKSDHCLIEIKLEIKKKQKQRRIDTKIIYIDQQKALTDF